MKILVTGGSGFIGTNLTSRLHTSGIEFVNLDVVKPKVNELEPFWVPCNLLDPKAVEAEFQLAQPTVVVHLAAETDTDPSKALEDYVVNTEGTANVLNSIRSCGSVERFVLTSTQFVNQSKIGPKHDEDFAPHTIYGESKIINEQQLRSAKLNCSWTIIRPTNIWGPWHLRYPFEFWKVLAEGKYFHPGHKRVRRSYGYVGNVVDQIMKIVELPEAVVNGKVFYVGDQPIDLYDWVNGFSLKQRGKSVIVVPRSFVFGLALIGDILRLVQLKFPITTSRFRSMTTDNPVDLTKTIEALGEPKYTLQQGIDETISWMRKVHPDLVKV